MAFSEAEEDDDAALQELIDQNERITRQCVVESIAIDKNKNRTYVVRSLYHASIFIVSCIHKYYMIEVRRVQEPKIVGYGGKV